jgi:Tol biopolymer transport system component
MHGRRNPVSWSSGPPGSIIARTTLVIALALDVTACTAGSVPSGVATEAPSSASSPATTIAPATSVSASPSAPAAIVKPGEDWVVYQWLDGNDDGIFLVRPDGTGQHPLVPDLSGSERHPDWSPDGSRIAFIHNTPADRSELWVVDADGQSATKVATCDLPCNEWNYPEWSADGSAIYVDTSADAVSGPPSTFGIDRFDVSSGARTTVLERKDGMTAEQHRISPDGKTVAFTRGDIQERVPGVSIYVADLQGGSERRITDPLLYAAYPDWTADGRIIFNTRDLGLFQDTTEVANLYVMDADGAHLTQLTDRASLDRVTQPRVTPDGKRVIYTQVTGEGWGRRTLAVIGLDGSGNQSLADPVIDGTHPEWRPQT